MVFSRGLVISLGVSALSATLLFLYFRNRMASVERKVDVMFDLIQSHESDRQQQMVYQQAMMQQQNSAPSSQNTGAWVEETTQPERNLIDVSDDDDSEGEYDSEDSREVSDNEEDLEERIKLVTTDIDVDQAEEVKNVEVLETNDTEPVTVDEAVELEEVTLEEDGTSGDVENTVQSADNDNDKVDDSLDEEDSEDEADEEEESDDDETQEVSEEVEYSKLKVAELKAIAEAKGLTNYKSLKKQPLIDLIKAAE